MDESTSKTCSMCDRVLPTSSFNKRLASRDGLQPKCRSCESRRKRELRRMSPAERAAANLRTQRALTNATVTTKACTACGVTKSIDDFHRSSDVSKGGRRAVCKSCVSEWHAKNYRDNRETIIERNRQWRLANPESAANLGRRYYEQHKERLYQLHRQWLEQNPDFIREFQNRRRAAIRASSIEKVDVEALWTGSCAICGGWMSRHIKHPHRLSRSLDHIVPVSRGGGHVAANLQWTHLICNIRKGASMPD